MGKAFKIVGTLVILGCTYKAGEIVGSIKGLKMSFGLIKDLGKEVINQSDELKIIFNGNSIILKDKENKENESDN